MLGIDSRLMRHALSRRDDCNLKQPSQETARNYDTRTNHEVGEVAGNCTPIDHSTSKKKAEWRPEPCPLSRSELRRIIAEQIG
jgi:hypothetical protein